MSHRFVRLLCLAAAVLASGAAAASADDVTFHHDVMAVLSKAGCNLGTCHGNLNGKGGFQLSLRGENSAADFATLTRDQNGRRANPLDADRSLLLLKPTMQVPHEGGRRFAIESPEYEILQRWIVAGMPERSSDGRPDAKVVRLDAAPREQVLVEPADAVQLRVSAVFDNGATREVTRFACFESSQPIVNISVAGLVRRERFGEVTISVRYLDQQVPVRLAFVPARREFVAKAPTPANDIDRHVFAKLQLLRINPSPVCDDTTFLRRAFLDLLGIPPTAEEARVFVQDVRADKRERLIDALLDRPEFADFWAIKWADLLRVEEKTLDRKGVATFHAWLRESLATNKPLDQFSRELITARGSTYEHPPANFYRGMRDSITRAETVAQVFLGTRLQCAKCHNHPFDRWTQNDYYGWANLFARVKYEVLENNRRDRNDSHEFDGEQLVLIADEGEVKHPGTGEPVEPRFLAASNGQRAAASETLNPQSAIRNPQSPAFSPSADRLLNLADWLTDRHNRRFAEVHVNRVWFHLLGKGIVDPIDDFRATNPPSNPTLLAALTDDFVSHGFDLRRLIRAIMTSRTYQLSTELNDTNRDDELNFSHALVRKLSAEQLADSLSLVLNARMDFNGYPPGTRASQLAGVRALRSRDNPPSLGDRFLTTFGKPPRLQACECERSEDATLTQTFQLVSGPVLNDLLGQSANRLSKWLAAKHVDESLIDDCFWTVLSRSPTPSELFAAKRHLQSSENRRANLEDIVWSLLNSDEFVLRH